MQVPEQLPTTRAASFVERERRILQKSHELAHERGVPITSIICVGHNTARAILETSREQSCDLIILGWKGFTSTARRILGEVVDDVVAHARSDVMLAKLVGEFKLKNLLLPTAGGPHARVAEDYAVSFLRSQGGTLTVLGVVPPKATEEAVERVQEQLDQAVERVE